MKMNNKVKGQILFHSKNHISTIVHKIVYLFMIIHIFLLILLYSKILIISNSDLNPIDFLILLIYPTILKLFYWLQNKYLCPVELNIYEKGIEISSKKIIPFLIKKKFISLNEIKGIYPIYRPFVMNYDNIENINIYFYFLKIVLKDNDEYNLTNIDDDDDIKMINTLKSLIGKSWDIIFDKYYQVRNISKKLYEQISYLNINEKIPKKGKADEIISIFALAQLYEIETGKNILLENIGDVNLKYKNLWKNIIEDLGKRPKN